jgi:tRNA splicing endonuclease
MCTHSDYIVGIYAKDQAILPLDIISMGRVGTNVKKTFVLAAKEEKEVTTFSIEWAGF